MDSIRATIMIWTKTFSIGNITTTQLNKLSGQVALPDRFEYFTDEADQQRQEINMSGKLREIRTWTTRKYEGRASLATQTELMVHVL